MKRYQLPQKTLNSIFTIHGFIQKPEGQLLYYLSKSASQKGVIVELGSWKGRSTVFLGLGVQNRNRVYAVDTFKGDKSTGFENTLNQFKKNLKLFKLTNVTAVKKSTILASRRWRKPISFLFIDASHTYKDTLQDFLAWEKFVIKDGVIALHDTQLPNPPRKVFERYILPNSKFKIINFVESTIVIKKVSSLNFWEKIVNYLIYHYRDLQYFVYINSWPLRKIAALFHLYHEKDL